MTTEKDRQRYNFADRPVRDDQPSGVQLAYQDADGVGSSAARGENGYVFAKDAPFFGPSQTWRTAYDVADAPGPATMRELPTPAVLADLELLREVNTGPDRLLNAYIRFWATNPEASETQLHMVLFAGVDLPQQEVATDADTTTNDGRTLWVPVGVTDQTLRGTDLAPFALNAPSVAYRNVYGSQLNLRASTVVAFDPAVPQASLALSFDVTPFSRVRLGVGASAANATAAITFELVR